MQHRSDYTPCKQKSLNQLAGPAISAARRGQLHLGGGRINAASTGGGHGGRCCCPTVSLPIPRNTGLERQLEEDPQRADAWVVAADAYANSTIPGVHALHGSTVSASACGAACEANHTCSVWTWSGETSHCWFAFDGKWIPMRLVGRTSGSDPSRVHGCSAAAPIGPSPPWDGSGATTLPLVVSRLLSCSIK